MPQIKVLDTPDLGLRPSETGVEARAAAARRGGGFFNQVAEAYGTVASLTNDTGSRVASTMRDAGDVAVKYAEHREISHGAAVGAQQIDGLNNAWTAALKGGKDADGNPIPPADPNDPSVAAKFREQMLEPALDKFKEGFTTERGQQWAEQFVDQYRKHMFEKTAADMSSLAKIASANNAQQTINSLSSASYTDPSSLRANVDAFKHSLDGIAGSANLSGTDQAALRTEQGYKGIKELTHAAIAGAISNGADWRKIADDPAYKPYIDRAEIERFDKAAKTQAKVDAYHEKSIAVAQRQLDDLNVHKNATDTISKNVSVDPQSGKPIINPQYFKDALEIARKNPDAPSTAATVRTMLDWGESQMNKSDHTTDPTVASTIDSRMFVPENPTTKMDVMRAEADKKMSSTDASLRMRIIDQRDKLPTDPQFKFAMDGAKQLIDGRTPGERSMQAGKYATFMQEFLPEYQRQKAAGTLPPNALSLRDPNSLLSKSMEAYKSPLAAAISGNGGIGAPAAPPRNDAMPAIPAASERPAGSIYDTPRGKMKWTGTGWVSP